MGINSVISAGILSKDSCKNLIDLYNRNKHLSGEWQGTNPLSLVYLTNEDYFSLKNIAEQLSNIASAVYESSLKIEVVELVKWPKNSSKGYHKDINRNSTVFTSVTYLNSNYQGGCTMFEEDLKIKPAIGKTIFFDGRNINHSVEKISHGDRYTLAIWYTNGQN